MRVSRGTNLTLFYFFRKTFDTLFNANPKHVLYDNNINICEIILLMLKIPIFPLKPVLKPVPNMHVIPSLCRICCLPRSACLHENVLAEYCNHVTSECLCKLWFPSFQVLLQHAYLSLNARLSLWNSCGKAGVLRDLFSSFWDMTQCVHVKHEAGGGASSTGLNFRNELNCPP